MRLLAVADLHYSLPQFDWVLEIAADFDVVVLAGDHLELASIVDRRAQSVVVRKYFSRLRALTRLVTCSGNHDLDAPNETGEKIAKWLGGGQTEGVSSDGESFVIDDTLFTICPWWDGPAAVFLGHMTQSYTAVTSGFTSRALTVASLTTATNSTIGGFTITTMDGLAVNSAAQVKVPWMVWNIR
jgi:Calcineurin-like phosphoesterase